MRAKARQSGLSMTEMTIVVAVVAVLTALSLPATRAFFNSIATAGGTRAMISASLAQARAIAAKEQRYAGIRFQKAYDPCAPDKPLKANQYIIFIIHDTDDSPDGTELANGFRVVDGTEPIKLPDNTGVMDLMLGTAGNIEIGNLPNPDTDMMKYWRINDVTTFSIIFSPSGKLMLHEIRTRNRNGKTDTTQTLNLSKDNIFNTITKITNPAAAPVSDPPVPFGMFIQDDYPAEGFAQEWSRRSFLIYERDKFKAAYENKMPWTGYLQRLRNNEMIHINPYTGRIISTE